MKQQNLPQISGTPQARRRFFSWVGKIASGTALAGVGLGLTNTSHAFAATQSKGAVFLASTLKRKPSVQPDCIDCSDCVTLGYVYNNCSSDPRYPYEIVWEVDTGCAPNCITHDYVVCASTCYDPC